MATDDTPNYQKCVNALTLIKSNHPNLVSEFAKWYEDGGWDDEDLQDEFLEDVEESSFIDWIKTTNVISTDEHVSQVWNALHNGIQTNESKSNQPNAIDINPIAIANTNPNIESGSDETKEAKDIIKQSIVVQLLQTVIDPKERKRHIQSSKSPTKQRIAKQSASMLPPGSHSGGMFHRKAKNQAQDMLLCELLGYKNNNYPLLVHFVDAYMRCQLNEWIIHGKQQNHKFSSSQFFEDYCVNPHFRSYMSANNAANTIDYVRTAIDSYQKRVLPSFQFMEPIYKINGNPLDISNYFFEIARIVRNCANQPIHNLTSIVPLQIDFMILNTKIKDVRPRPEDCKGVSALFSDDDWDEHDETKSSDDEDFDENENICKDLDKLFGDKKIKFRLYKNPLREMLRCTEDIKRIGANQRSQRSVFILDRRQNKNCLVSESDNINMAGTDGDKLYLFRPNKHNKFEDNAQELVHSALHHNSVVSIVPRGGSGNKPDFTVRESLRGQMFVLSYHIISKDEIRCYLFYQGQCFRFFGADLINVLPIFFLNQKKVRDMLLSRYNDDSKWRQAFDEFADTFVDTKFELFYHGLTAKSPRINVVQ